MGTIKDLKKGIYGKFIEWLKLNKLEDPFDNDVWASKIFDVLYKQFTNQNENLRATNEMPIDLLKELVKKREEGKIMTPDKKIVLPK